MHVATALLANCEILETFDHGLIKKSEKVGGKPSLSCANTHAHTALAPYGFLACAVTVNDVAPLNLRPNVSRMLASIVTVYSCNGFNFPAI